MLGETIGVMSENEWGKLRMGVASWVSGVVVASGGVAGAGEQVEGGVERAGWGAGGKGRVPPDNEN